MAAAPTPTTLPFAPGVFVALVTPFQKGGGALDEAAFRALVRHLVDDVDGLVTAGTTGEFPYLAPEERARLVELAVEEARGKPVVAGTGAASTREAIAHAARAERAGAAACLVVTPYFLHPSDKGIHQHFEEVASAVRIPIILYNIPQVVGAPLPRRVIEDLADLDGIVGLKDSSGDLAYTMEVLEMVRGRLDVLVGHDEVVLPALAAGCSGAILGSANVIPRVWREVLSAVRQGDLPTARARQGEAQKLARICARHGGAVAVKAALHALGQRVGRPRRPLRGVGGALMHEVRAEIRLELEKLGLLEGRHDEPRPPRGDLATRFAALGLGADVIRSAGLRLGSGSAGSVPEDVQIDLVAGPKAGPLGDAYAYQLTYPLHRRQALHAILEPNLTARPPTLIVPTLEQRNLRQADMIHGPTQSAAARAVADALEGGTIPRSAVDEEVLILSATVDPRALDRHALHRSVLRATRAAVAQAYGRGDSGER